MTMRTFIIPFAIAIGSVLHAQDLPSVKATAKGYVDQLAGTAMHGRGYVQGGDSLAADWMGAQFDRLGLDRLNDQRFERFHFPINTFPDSIHFSVDGHVLQPGVDYLVDAASGSDLGDFDLVHLTLADLTTPERRSLTMGVIAGHAVYLDFPLTTDRDSLALYAQLEDEVARYVPVLHKAQGRLIWDASTTQKRHAIIQVDPRSVSDSARSVHIEVLNHFVRSHPARNVLGVVKARGGSRDWIVITAHYDHLGMMGPDVLFPGANDNASGCSMLLCLAEQVKKHPLKQNVLFIAFAGEEAGLQGSMWCVTDRPIDLARISLLVNLDLNGTGDDGITVVNATEQKKAYDDLVAINDRTHRLAQVKARGPACNSDHCPFAQHGVPAVFIYTMGGIAAYHDVFDKPETLPLTRFDEVYRTLYDLLKAW